MSLIIKNTNTLKNTVVIVFKNHDGKKDITKVGDFTFIKVKNKIVGLNIFNASNYIVAKEGAHSLDLNQKKFLQKNNIEIEDDFPFFQIGKIIKRENHPKSDKLFVLKVKTNKELQIVTNSKNSTINKKVVVANISATLPNGKVIRESKVMGIKSEGMLCGTKTLGMEKSEGILIVEGIEGNEFVL